MHIPPDYASKILNLAINDQLIALIKWCFDVMKWDFEMQEWNLYSGKGRSKVACLIDSWSLNGLTRG